MFCPNCGSNQPNDKRFCTSCGTNLGAVSAALSGQMAAPASAPATGLIDAEARYKRQMAAAIQHGAPGLGLLVAALLVLFFRPIPGAWFWICFGLTIGGISTLGKGITMCLLARTEWQAALARAQATQPLASFTASPPAAQFNPSSPTNPHLVPPSVTEETTRHLQ
jgi:hypothetical protein